MKCFSTLVVIGLMLILPGLALATPQEYHGVVNHVYDSATVRMAYRGGQIHVKLAGIPACSRAEDNDRRLAGLLLGKPVRVEAIRWEKGFLIGRVFADGRSVCDTLAGAGADRPHAAELATPL